MCYSKLSDSRLLNSPSHETYRNRCALKKRCKGTTFFQNPTNRLLKKLKIPDILFQILANNVEKRYFCIIKTFNYLWESKVPTLKTHSTMINRELIRIKIVQLTYAYYQNGSNNLTNAEKDLMYSLSQAYTLYNYLLMLIVAISEEMRHRVEVNTNRAKREGTEPPATKFVDNRFALQLENNNALLDYADEQKITWSNDVEFVRRLCNLIEQSQIYQDYMADSEDSYEADREVWRKLYKAIIQDNDDLDALLEEKSIYWNDDKEIVDTFVLKTIKRFDPSNGKKQELLPEYNDDEDKEFARKLFRATILNADQYQRYMSDASRNWDFSRLAYMDVVIMQIAIAEMMTFMNIPISVTINEFVALAKLYSTSKSGGYINGMLDTIARFLVDSGELNKPVDDLRPKKY